MTMTPAQLFCVLVAGMVTTRMAAAADITDTIQAEIADLDAMVASSDLVNHDFLQCFQKGSFPDMHGAAATFAANHFVYSRNFIHYLQSVADKIDDPTIAEPIVENMAEENGNYEQRDLDAMAKAGIPPEWYDKLPHKVLSVRFHDALGLNSTNTTMDSPGGRFTDYMINMYAESTACEALAVIGFAIEETVSTLYKFVWAGLKDHTDMTDRDMVFFPLHILVDDGHAALLKESFLRTYQKDPGSCKNVKRVVAEVLERRSQMFTEVRLLIEAQQPTTSCDVSHRNEQETMSNAINKAKRQTSKMPDPGYTHLEKMALSARILGDEGHGDTLAGQITCRDVVDGELSMWTTKYGVLLEEVTEKDFLMIDENLEVREGEGFPNMATRFHLHVYRNRSDINCIVHTHPPATAALALTGKRLEIEHMDVMALYDDVPFLEEWPGVPFGDWEGELIAGVLAPNHMAALLAHHGLIVGGRTLEEATYRAWFFERAARMQLDAVSSLGGGGIKHTKSDVAEQARDWRIDDGPVKAHFNAWARRALRQPKHADLSHAAVHAQSWGGNCGA